MLKGFNWGSKKKLNNKRQIIKQFGLMPLQNNRTGLLQAQSLKKRVSKRKKNKCICDFGDFAFFHLNIFAFLAIIVTELLQLTRGVVLG